MSRPPFTPAQLRAAPSKSLTSALIAEMRGYLRDLEKDYADGHDLAFLSLKSSTYNRVSGGGRADPTGLTAAQRQKLKERLARTVDALRSERDEIRRTCNGLHEAVYTDGEGDPTEDTVEYPKVIGDAHARSIHLARERKERGAPRPYDTGTHLGRV